MHNFTVDRNTGVVKEDDNHITFASGKLTIHIYLNQQGNVVGECVVRNNIMVDNRTVKDPPPVADGPLPKKHYNL